MDLQEFNGEMLRFDEAENPEIERLVTEAALNYGPESEQLLLSALQLDNKNLTVLIGLYRFYYYQHRYINGLDIAHKVMAVVAEKIGFPQSWQALTLDKVKIGLMQSFYLVRLYFFALKAAGYLNLRLHRYEEGRVMIEKVVAFDSKDRIGASLLLKILDNNSADVIPFQPKETMRQCNDAI